MNRLKRLLAVEQIEAPVRSRRAYVLAGAVLGLAIGVFARVWMRTISEDPVFTPVGTGLILVVFAGMGACVGLALAWRRLGSPRRMLVQRGVALVPYLLLGPFMLLFLPGFLAALVATHGGWWRLARWPLTGIAALGLLFLMVAMFSNGVASGLMYAVLAFAFYLTNRIAVAPKGPAAGAGPLTA